MADDLIVLDPWPRRTGQLFDAARMARLEALGRVVEVDSRADPGVFEQLLPDATVLLGQPDFPRERLDRAPGLRALVNLEGNLFPNVDYPACLARGVRVLSIAPAFAIPVAELALGLALDLARGITHADAAMRAGTELYGSKGGTGGRLLSYSTIGIVGYGAIGRALRRLLGGFSATVQVFDPWLPASLIREDDAVPVSLEGLLGCCDIVFVCAAATSENRHLIGRADLEAMPEGAALILVSRADLVDFAALTDLVGKGRLRAAVDVFPEEPVPPADPIRQSRLLLSPHRAGGIPAAMATAADMVLDDLDLILRGLPPVRLQEARSETVGLARSKPASYR